MLPIATSTNSTYVKTPTAFGVLKTVMIMSTDSLSAPALSTPAKFWLLRLHRPPTAMRVALGTSSCVKAGLIWPSSFVVCMPLQSALWRPMLKTRVSLVFGMALGHCWSLLALGWLMGLGWHGFVGCLWTFFFASLELSWGCLFSLGLWFYCVIVFLLFFSLFVRLGGLKSAKPWGCLWFLFFSFLDVMDIEH